MRVHRRESCRSLHYSRASWGSQPLILLFTIVVGCTAPGPRPSAYIDPAHLPDAWRTRAERTNYDGTARYDETVAFCRQLANASPYAHFTSFGVSGEGRPLPLLIVSHDRAFTPAAAAASGKLLVLMQNCIHAGECEGKDACLELARDMLITGTRAALLDHVNVLIMPIFNTDGHERFDPYSRINQNGPRELGWRVTATNLNLNRDYMKADAVEMQAWLRCWNAWRPDFFFDNHTTDGSDCQYDLFYSTTTDADADPQVAAWIRDALLPALLPALAADGHVVGPYMSPRDERDLSKGFESAGPYSPRLSTGYSAICNRPTFLVETHAPKPYGRRVRATYDIMVHTLEELNRAPVRLRAAIRAADERGRTARGMLPEEPASRPAATTGPASRPGAGGIALRQVRVEEGTPLLYRAIEQRFRPSAITGGEVVEFTGRPQDVESKIFECTRVEKAVTPPAAYLVPPQWRDVIDRLEWHGIEFFRLARPARLDVESCRFEKVKFAGQCYESRQRVSFECAWGRAVREFPAGTVVVPLNQARAKLVVHLLEPEAPDALVGWGFFNAVMEQKEYAEAYVMEPIAQKMLAADPALQREFEEKLKADAAFAADPGARLDFFYQRSPYRDEALNVYPIVRLWDEAALVQLRP